MDLMGGAFRSGVRIRCHFPSQTASMLSFFNAYKLRGLRLHVFCGLQGSFFRGV